MRLSPRRSSLSVVKPETSGPGGDLFALVYMKKTGKVEALNASGPAPAKASIEYFHDHGLKAHSAIRSAQHRCAGRGGRLVGAAQKIRHAKIWRVLTADAIRIAREGFPISQEFRRKHRRDQRRISLGRSLLSPAARRGQAGQDPRAKGLGRRFRKDRAERVATVSTPAKSPTRFAPRSKPKAASSRRKICSRSFASGWSR